MCSETCTHVHGHVYSHQLYCLIFAFRLHAQPAVAHINIYASQLACCSGRRSPRVGGSRTRGVTRVRRRWCDAREIEGGGVSYVPRCRLAKRACSYSEKIESVQLKIDDSHQCSQCKKHGACRPVHARTQQNKHTRMYNHGMLACMRGLRAHSCICICIYIYICMYTYAALKGEACTHTYHRSPCLIVTSRLHAW